MNRSRYKTNQKNPQVKAYTEAVRRGMQNQHVVPRDGGWAVKKAGARKASGIYKSQKAAVRQATSIARNQGTVVFIHKRDGRIRR